MHWMMMMMMTYVCRKIRGVKVVSASEAVAAAAADFASNTVGSDVETECFFSSRSCAS